MPRSGLAGVRPPVAALVLCGTGPAPAASVGIVAEGGPNAPDPARQQADLEDPRAEAIEHGWRQDAFPIQLAFFGGLDLFGLDLFAESRYRAVHDGDPQVYFQHELADLTDFEPLNSLDLRMETARGAGPPVNDTFSTSNSSIRTATATSCHARQVPAQRPSRTMAGRTS